MHIYLQKITHKTVPQVQAELETGIFILEAF